MRLLNFLLHLALVSLMFWAANLEAQQNGNLPTVRQSNMSQLTVSPGALGAAVQSGNTLVFDYCWESGVAPTACTSCTDANGVIPSITVGTMSVNGGNCTGNPFDEICAIQPFWGKATSTGTPAITCSCTFPRQNIFTTQELTGNLTFDAQSQANSVGADPAIAVTSTQQNDVLVPSICNGGQTTLFPDKTLQSASDSVTSELTMMQNWWNTGAAGSQTSQYHSAANLTASDVVAFKPTAITVATTLMPDGGTGAAYTATFKAYGGSGAYTWTLASGSCSGLSITDATNGIYSGTPNVAGSCTITPHVTDGVNSANGPALTFTIGSVLSSIGNPICSTFGVNPNGATLSVAKGDPLYLCYLGDDQHGQNGYTMVPYSDSLGNIYVRSNPITGGMAGPIQCLTAKSDGSGVVNPIYTALGGTPLAGAFCTAKGAQQIVDDLVTNTANPGAVASTTLTSTYTPPVTNGLLLTLSTVNCLATGGGSCTMTTSTNSPFTSVASVVGFGGVPFAVYQQSAPTVTSYSATSNFADSFSPNMAHDTPIQAMIFLRPAPPAQTVVLGEKHRRHPE